jgi:YesN/AraC family two-component response regulator
MSNVLLIEDDRFLIDDLKTFIEFEATHAPFMMARIR